MKHINNLSVNALRTLAVDAVEKANSGHPGIALGAAPIAYTVWADAMNFNPKDSTWINRDRFILSAGHGSALLYSLLHLFSYDVSLDDLKQFRQFESLTPGHPEYGHTHGVEATTGPLGAGLSTAVGMAMAQEHLAAKYNKENYPIFDNYTFVLSGDGCMMEGITSEASSLAGALELGRLIVLYDSNAITIEGNTDLAFKENVRARYEAYGFETFLVEDGNDLETLSKTISKAKSNLNQPSFIEIKTKIGYGTPKEGSASSHGSPIGQEGINIFKKSVNYPSMESFFVPEEVYAHTQNLIEQKQLVYKKWQVMKEQYDIAYPQLAQQLEQDFKDITIGDLLADPQLFEFEMDSIATRSASGLMINRLKEKYPQLIGGSADLAPSNMTHIEKYSSFASDNYGGSNLHFGIREHAMAAIGNGLVLYGGLKAYVATFFVFADFLKPMARLSSLMSVPLTYVLTHDSIGVGEDGPTHEPIEQLAMFRSMPNYYTFRPADAKETAYGWALALSSKQTPVGLVLSRQNLPVLESTSQDALKGAYVVYEPNKIDAIVIATGSEVSLAIDTAKTLANEGIGVRVVSMPCQELFDEQTKEYKENILPSHIRARVAVEAASSFGWAKYVGLHGTTLTIDTFGGSAPGPQLFEHFGFTIDNLKQLIKKTMEG